MAGMRRRRGKQEYLELPREVIVEEILPRLPVKSLLRFKSVCKEWDSLISNNHDFAKLQLQFQRTTTCNNNQYYCLVEEFPKPGTQNSCSCCGNRLLSLKLEVVAVAIAEMRKFPCNGSVVGTSNGLICVSHDICYKKLEDTEITRITLRYEIWNPATGGRWHIPAPPRVLDHHDICVGFGYISSLDDYKIVILKSRTYHTKQIHHVMTYSCSTKTWKQIEQRDEKPDYLEYGAASGIQVGESLHWGLRGRAAASNPVHPIVLAFNLGNDLIHWLRVSLPDPEWPLPTRYFVFKDGGHLCVSWANNKRCDRSYKEVDDTVFMLDDDDGSKWKQIFTFEDVQCLYPHRYISDTHSTVGIVNRGRILVYITAATSGGPEKLAVQQQQLDTPDPVSLLIRTNDHIQTLITPFTSRRRPTTILPIVDPSKK